MRPSLSRRFQRFLLCGLGSSGLLATALLAQSGGPGLGLPAVINVRDTTNGAVTPLLFKRPGLLATPANGINQSLPGAGLPLVTAEALHWRDINTWSQLVLMAPGAGQGRACALDPASGHLLLFGGLSGGYSNGSWSWDGTNWLVLSPPASPSARAFAALTSVASRSSAVLFGGETTGGALLQDTWEWAGTTWSAVPSLAMPPARARHAMAFHPGRGRIVLFGGAGSAPPILGDTWEWDATTAQWASVAGPAPGARSGHAMVHDAARGEVVLFGGLDGTGARDDTWVWTAAGQWQQRSPAVRPPARYGHGLAFDPVRNVAVLCGGVTTTGATACDTWEWNGTTWRQRFPCVNPPVREYAAMAYDPITANVLMVGGSAYGDTWLWDPPGPSVRVNDISIGQDFIPATGTGPITVAVPPNAWIGLAFSVTRTSLGAPGSFIEAERLGNGGVGSDLFNYVFRNSTCLPPPEVQVTKRAVDSSEGTAGAAHLDVCAVDVFLPAYDNQPTYYLPPGPQDDPSVYFTVTSADVGLVPRAWWNGQFASAATILRTTWDKNQRAWSCPERWLGHSEIQFNGVPLGPGEEIDGLAIGWNGDPTSLASTRYLLFSTKRPTAVTSQFMICPVPGALLAMPPVAASVYESVPGTPIETEVGIGNADDADGICTYDPCNPTPGRTWFNLTMGQMKDDPTLGLIIPQRGQMASWRETPPGAVDRLRVQTTGGSPVGNIDVLLLSPPTFLAPPGPFYMGAVLPDQAGISQLLIDLPQGLRGAVFCLHWVRLDALAGAPVMRASTTVSL